MKMKILFLCTGNSCRSQMAEGWANLLKYDILEAHSAGVSPQPVNEYAIRVMAEVGVDISRSRSKHVNDILPVIGHVDYVITVCADADETCPELPLSTRKYHIGFDDPPRLATLHAGNESAIIRVYRDVRDKIREFVAHLPANLSANHDA